MLDFPAAEELLQRGIDAALLSAEPRGKLRGCQRAVLQHPQDLEGELTRLATAAAAPARWAVGARRRRGGGRIALKLNG